MNGLELANAIGGLVFGAIATAGLIVTLTIYFARKFNKIDKQFDSIDERFNGVDERFDSVDKRFDGIDRELAEIKKLIKSSTSKPPSRVI